jgi:hypothetical protein
MENSSKRHIMIIFQVQNQILICQCMMCNDLYVESSLSSQGFPWCFLVIPSSCHSCALQLASFYKSHSRIVF